MPTDHLQEARDMVLRAETTLEQDAAGERVPGQPVLSAEATALAQLDLLAAADHALIDMAATLRRLADAIPPDPPAPAPPVASAAPARYDEDLPY